MMGQPVGGHAVVGHAVNVQQQPGPVPVDVPQQNVSPAMEEEKASTEVTSGGPTSGSSPVQKKPQRRVPPWEPFTGPDKNHPIKYGWAHRVRQVLSADTLKIALLRDPKTSDPLAPPRFISVTLDGIDTPRCERYIPPQRAAETEKSKDDDTKGSPSKTRTTEISKDQPFAYEAREFVRKLVMNKNVFYAIWRPDPNTNRNGPGGSRPLPRNWGDLYFKGEDGTIKSLTQELVAAGFASVTERKTDLSQQEKGTLMEKQDAAQKASRGKWNKRNEKNAVRDIEWVQWNKHGEFGEKYKGQILSGIVDGVISGSSLRMELCVDPKERLFKNVVVNLAGVNAPRDPILSSNYKKNTNRRRNKDEELLERLFGAKAKEWTEMRLLSQEVKVHILFTSSQQIIAQVLCSQGRIAPSLVKKGLAKYEAWSASQVDKEERRMLELSAKQAVQMKMNIWQHIKEGPKTNEKMVVVTQVISGDTVEVLDPTEKGGNKKVRYTLSSIRCPRIGTRGGYKRLTPEELKAQREQEQKEREQDGGKKRRNRGGRKAKDEWSTEYATPDEYLSREAKELVRSMCIGKQVRLCYEYDRPMLGGGRNRGGRTQPQFKRFATIFVKDAEGNEKNVALELVRMGYAELVWHAKDEQKRSMAYVDLENASKKAIREKKGVNKYRRRDKERQIDVADQDARRAAAKRSQIRDFSGNDEGNVSVKDRVSLNQFLLNQRVNGIVEFVFGGNRVKIFIPEKKAYIAMRLAGIRVGNYTSNREQDEVSKQAKEYLNNAIMQREVQIMITSTGQEQRGGRGRRGRGRGRGGGRQGAPTRNPNLDGHIFMKEGVETGNPQWVNIADRLLQQGMAQVIVGRYGDIMISGPATVNFLRLEEEAQNKRLGVWKDILDDDGQGGDDSKRQGDLALRSKTGQAVEVVVSHISSATEFYVNDANSKQMGVVNQKLAELSKNPKVPLPKAIKGGKKVKFAAKYDGFYARCRVTNPDRRGTENGDGGNTGYWFVDFIDYGNRASVSRENLAELPDDLRIDRIPPLAMKCVLTGLRVDPNGGYFVSAGRFVSSLAFPEQQETKLKMRILHDDLYRKTWYVDLSVGDESINQMLANEGYVTRWKPRDLPRCFSEKGEYGQAWSEEHAKAVDEYFAEIRSNIEIAKSEHKNIYQHGDVSEEDEEDNLGDAGGGRRR